MPLALRRSARLLAILAHFALGIALARTVLIWASRCSVRGAHWRAGIAQSWIRRLNRLLRVRIIIHGSISETPTLFVANHISWLDITCLHAALGADFVAKQEVAHWPLVGAMAREAGTMFLRRGDPCATEAVADRITWLLKRGRSAILFPEGTTTDGTSVRRFHSRLYLSALRTHAHIQAVAIAYPHPAGVNPAAPFVGDDDLARHLWRLLAEPSIDVTLTFLPRVTAAGFGSRRAVAEYTRSQIAAALGIDTAPRLLRAAGGD